MKRLTALAVLLSMTLAGCGGAASLTGTKTMAGTVRAAEDDHEVTHKALNAIVKSVLTAQLPHLLATADANKDGAISTAEYAKGHTPAATAAFVAQFDTNQDGSVPGAEYTQALNGSDAAVEAFHHVVEEHMSAHIKPYMADKNFDATDLREYMTKHLGLTADFPQLFALMAKMDLNEDDKLLSGKGEGPAFLLTFAAPELQTFLGLPTALATAKRK